MVFPHLFQYLYMNLQGYIIFFFLLLLKQLKKFSKLHLSLAKCKLADLFWFHSPSTTDP